MAWRISFLSARSNAGKWQATLVPVRHAEETQFCEIQGWQVVRVVLAGSLTVLGEGPLRAARLADKRQYEKPVVTALGSGLFWRGGRKRSEHTCKK